MQTTSSNASKHSSKFAPWMVKPKGISDCPNGLEYLAVLDQLFVEQQVEMTEVITGVEGENSYIVKNNIGEKIYFAQEHSDVLGRTICGHRRMFDITITDKEGNTVLQLFHPLACDYCCCPCWLQSIEVATAGGTLLGKVIQKWSLWIPRFKVTNAHKKVIFRIKGPCCTCSCCCGSSDVQFKLINPYDKSEVGYLSKYWSGLAKEVFTDADNFGVSFPMDTDIKMKAVLLGAIILIDYMFFETNSLQNRALLAAMLA
ncbi:hypothetical protein ILUMI_24661 [Ignelater luminosus]|uniref:Phospholipid scramblase n=1 Tax=Ignelater luminosus TaxID=2038154 RepID=A0A8K0G0R9_IGNLU|nr:hypothetical protein ILUMI_24661 [Ignelater luminosus]